MKLSKSIYLDSFENQWVIEKISIKKNKGNYIHWIGECKNKSIGFREKNKKDIIKRIKELKNITLHF